MVDVGSRSFRIPSWACETLRKVALDVQTAELCTHQGREGLFARICEGIRSPQVRPLAICRPIVRLTVKGYAFVQVFREDMADNDP